MNESTFWDIVLKNKSLKRVLDAGTEINLPDWYLAAGCVVQTVYNKLHGFPLDYGIEDYDLVYFDRSCKEDPGTKKIIEKTQGINVEIVNEAFVHIWIEQDRGFTLPPYTSSEDAIATWPCLSSCLGIKKEKGEYKLFAPFGLEDLFNLTIRPNRTTHFPQKAYDLKAQKWLKKWPNLKIIPW